MFGIRYNVNICDNILRDLEIHFTKACDNQCPFCIDRMNKGIDESPRPNVDAIMGPVILYGEHIDYIGIAGGEPCLYIDELYDLCNRIKSWYPKKHLNLITSVPETCYKNKETFFKRNAVINRRLKQIAQETGEKLCYKIVLSNQYKLLRNTTLEFAVFRTDDGKYNVVFLESQKSAIEKALGSFKPKAPNANINPNLKL